MKSFRNLSAILTVVAMASTASAWPNFPEGEPNDSKATANIINCMAAGDTITGNSTSATTVGLDYFDVRACALPQGIYRHRLVLTSAITGHTATIRALTQTASPPDTLPGIPWDGVVGAPTATETSIQTHFVSGTSRINQWYGFGKGERFHYRVTGAAATTADYVATMETVPVAPTPIGSFAPGLITINTFGQGHSSDTDLWVYNSNLDAIPGYGNDDESLLAGSPGGGATLQSWLARNYAPGTYYMALSNFHLSNNMPSPSDDDFRTGTLMEFSNHIVNSSPTTGLNMAFTIADSAGTSIAVPNTKVGQFDVNWFSFIVTPEPATLGLLGVGALALIRRRRRA